MNKILIDVSGISIASTLSLLNEYGNVTYELDNCDKIRIERSVFITEINGVEIKKTIFMVQSYVIYAKGFYQVKLSQYFSIDNLSDAIDCFIGRLTSSDPHQAFGESKSLHELFIGIGHNDTVQPLAIKLAEYKIPLEEKPYVRST